MPGGYNHILHVVSSQGRDQAVVRKALGYEQGPFIAAHVHILYYRALLYRYIIISIIILYICMTV